MTLLEEMLRVDPFFGELDRLSRGLLGSGKTANTGNTGATLAMPMDLLRRGEDLLVRIDLPGLAPESLNVTVEGRTLTIEATRAQDEQDGDVVYLRGRGCGTVRQQITLPDNLDVERVQASYDNGVLTVRIPVAEHAKPRRIEIQNGLTGNKQITTGTD
jgi:HSP20 family protein